MNRTDRFIKIMGKLESNNDWQAWGDDGKACGRFQWHPSAFADWGPSPEDFGGVERTWDWAFEWALRNFHEFALVDSPGHTDAEIAMAWHLHGQLHFEGWENAYKAGFDRAAAAVDAER